MPEKTQSYDSVPLEDFETIQAIVKTMQEVESFSRLNDEAQVRFAKKIDEDPVGFAMHTLQTVEHGLEQNQPLLNEAELLLKLAYKVACEYSKNGWLISKLSHCLASINTGKISEVKVKVLEVLGNK